MGLLIFWAIVFVIIMIHEAGHLVIAKSFGVQVNVFSIGFGFRIIGIKAYKGKFSIKILNRKASNEEIWNNKEITEYRIAPIPFGGYCSMEGEINASGNKKELASQPFSKKIFVAFAGIIANIVTGIGAIYGVLAYKYGFMGGVSKTAFYLCMLWRTFLTLFDGNYQITTASDVNSIMTNVSGIEMIFYFGFFSILMAIVNAIPFPALDGSLPFLWLAEKFSGEKGKKIINFIWISGFVLLMLLQILIFYFWIWG